MSSIVSAEKSTVQAKLLFLRRISIFQGVSEDNLAKIAALTAEKLYTKKSIICHEGDKGDTLYIIKVGRVKIAKVAMDGREKTLAIMQPGDFFGEMALFDDLPRSATAEAIDCEVRLLALNKRDFERAINENPSIALAIMRDLTRRIRAVNQQIEDLAFKDVHGRVASTLLSLAQTEGQKANGQVTIKIRMTHQDLANMVGSSRETVTRALNRMQAEGVIAISHQQITLLDPEALANWA